MGWQKVIKNDKLYEYGNTVNRAWEFPEEALELPGVSLNDFEEQKDKYVIENGILKDISSTSAYSLLQNEKEKTARINEIKSELSELDIKSIRAIREGGEDENGILYLEKYQTQINALRTELNNLK